MKTFHASTVAAALLLGACTQSTTTGGDTPAPIGDGFASATAIDGTTLIVSFTRKLDRGSVQPSTFSAWNRTVVPAVQLTVSAASASGDAEVTLTTSMMEPGARYTLTIAGLRDDGGHALDGTLNFTGGGAAPRAEITFTIADDARLQAFGAVKLMLSVDPASGAFTDRLREFSVASLPAGAEARVQVAVDTRRTLTRLDDGDTTVDRRAYAARVVTAAGVPASPLVLFEVTGSSARTVDLPLLEPPVPVRPADGVDPPTDPNPGDGVRRVRVFVDDRMSRELTSAALRCAFDEAGNFDVNFPQTVTMSPMGDPHLFVADVNVKVDPARVADGMDENTLPYIAILVANGADAESINLSITAPDETPQAVRMPLGDATMTPVLFRVDVGNSFLVADGSQRGLFAGEAVFLTGEWQRAADALGRNAGDSFSGGEQLTLEMKPDPDHAGVWFKAIWLPPGRPYGWKVSRCQSGVGCGPLNARVASSGRAFATVMKNLATENLDAFANPQVVIVDPGNLSAVTVGTSTLNYSNARVHIGMGMGGEGNPAGVPDGMTLFKQEVPDLAVVVDTQPITTPVYVVGTWRDVNLPVRPSDILTGGATVNLSPYDYDEGFIGRYPPQRSAP